MKILYQNRPPESWIGGDAIQLGKTMEAAEKLGHETEFAVTKSPLQYREFDLIHCFNFSMKWTKNHIIIAKLHKKPLVCSMIYHESDMFIPYEEQQLLLDAVDAQIYLVPGELERVKRHLRVDESKVHFVPNGIDEHWFEPQSVDPSVGDYVLTVGRIEPHKGQLGVAKACKELNIPYVCIGEKTDIAYANKCEKEAAEILNPMKPEDLKRFYASCKVFALASRAEVMPLTIMEAGAQQANIVVADHCEWKDIPNAVWCKFDDVESIKSAISIALLKPKNKELQDKLRGMTWDKVGEQLNKIYESLVVGKTE